MDSDYKAAGSFQANNENKTKNVFVVLPNEKKKINLSPEEKEAFDEELLRYVFDRPPLFNYCLPIQDRSPDIVNRLWAEVLQVMLPSYPNINVAILKEAFKYHRDLYMRYKTKSTKVPSWPAPKHFEILRQLDNVIAKRKQISDVEWMEQSLNSTANFEYVPQQEKIKALSTSPCSARSQPGSSTSTRSNSGISEATSESDIDEHIGEHVGAVQLSATQRNDRAQNFGDQVAWHMRGLSDVEFFEAAAYINNYFYEKAKERQSKEDQQESALEGACDESE